MSAGPCALMREWRHAPRGCALRCQPPGGMRTLSLGGGRARSAPALPRARASDVTRPQRRCVQDRVGAFKMQIPHVLSDPLHQYLDWAINEAATTLKVVAHITACKSATRACSPQTYRAAPRPAHRRAEARRWRRRERPGGRTSHRRMRAKAATPLVTRYSALVRCMLQHR